MPRRCRDIEDHEWVPSDNPQHVGGMVCQVCGLDPEDAAIEDYCGEPETCWHCGGDGGHHDCGEDTCCCADPEINVPCNVCGGTGEI